MYDELELVNNTANHRFEITVEGQRANINYRQIGDVYLLVHTEVPDALQGHGIAAALVEKTFNYLEENHLKMRPYCAYIQSYLKDHPEWKRLIDK
jgi:predicted GNAT family acetyltransferase